MVKNRLLRFVLIVVGFISLALGVVGIIIPILPSVPFFLLTSLCFVKSSKKFNEWFLNTKIYKKYLENFQKNKVMTLKAELILLILVSSILMISMYFINNLAMTIVFTILIAAKFSYFSIYIRPVSKKEFLCLRNQIKKELN